MNPNDVTPQFASFLKRLGVNRVSMGIQSFNDAHLKWMNRRHSSSEAVEAFNNLRSAGFSNISCDLIFGFPSLSASEWLESIAKMVALAPEHISCYQMSVEKGTPLALWQVEMPSQEESANQYSVLQRELLVAGYQQYEISNFALPGYESKHNSSYWNAAPYLGFGPGAHSFNGKCRSWNVPVLKRYLEYWNEGEAAKDVTGSEQLTPENLFNEMIMLGLRQVRGVSKSALEALPYYHLVHKEILRQKTLGNLEEDNGYIRIPASKLFISDSIIRELFV